MKYLASSNFQLIQSLDLNPPFLQALTISNLGCRHHYRCRPCRRRHKGQFPGASWSAGTRNRSQRGSSSP